VTDPRPVLLVTSHAPPERVGAFAALHAREGIEVALFGGRLHHAVAGAGSEQELPFPVRRPAQRAVHALAASGRYRAVVCGTGGRLALPAAYAGARRARVPFVLWASLWAQPRSAAGLAGYPLVRAIYARADAVATYGPHVSAYVRARGARRVVEAPQAIDGAFWGAPAAPRRHAPFQVLFAGRLAEEKGVAVLLEAWQAAKLATQDGAALVLAGEGPLAAPAAATPGALVPGALAPADLRNFYAGSDVVVIPSLPTRTFREPWGLVVNEAMSQGRPVIASDAVGAAAGGLVRDGQTGLVVPAGDPGALAGALCRLHGDPALRRALGARARQAVTPYSFAAWADGISRALHLAGQGR
jgi:glycosyltransferase involved in cell wall biosynthesis